MISKVRIQNFKKICDETFELDRLNVFIGSNNTGKSSVLQAIQFAVGTAQTGQRMGVRNNPNSATISFSANPSSFLYLPIIEVDALINNRNLTQSNGAEISFSSEKGDSTITIKRGKNRNLSMTMSKSTLLDDLQNCQSPFCVYTPGLSGISLSEEFKNKAVVLKSATRGDSNFYLRNILLLLSQKDEWQEFQKAFKRFFPTDDIKVQFNPDEDDVINAFVDKLLPNGELISLPIDAMGTSALQILQILSYVYYFAPPILILDEPDTHLHPNNQRLLMTILNDFTKDHNTQVLISTHSRHIIDELNDEASFFWMQDGHLAKKICPGTNDAHNDIINVLLDLGAFDFLDYSTPGIKYLICTEDARYKKDNYFHAILEASGIDTNAVKIVSYNGCSKIDCVKIFSSFIAEYRPDWKIIVHRDRDYLSPDEIKGIEESFAKANISLWVTPGTDMESIFIKEAHIKYLFPELSNDLIRNMVKEVISEAKGVGIEKLSKHLQEQKQAKDHGKYDGVIELLEKTNTEYDSAPERYLYGKKALGLLEGKIQEALKRNVSIAKPSPYIKQEDLIALLS